MSSNGPNEVTRKTVRYHHPVAEAVTVQHDLEFPGADGRPLLMDLYLPERHARGSLTGVAVMVHGYPDEGMARILGCRFKDMAASASWGRLLAAEGIAAVAYTNRNPVADLDALLGYLRRHAAGHGLDGERLGLWACSGHVPLAVSKLRKTSSAGSRVTCAALLYGFMLDLDGGTAIQDASHAFKFVNPVAGVTTDDLCRDVPLLIARAGQDQFPGLNEAIDRFVSRALALNLPLTVINLPEAPHAFDLDDASRGAGETIKQVLQFMRFHLGAAG